MPDAPILTLPDELLVEVMKDVGRPLRLSAVCASWRRSALRHPPLWATIPVEDNAVFVALPQLQEVAARAGSLPLNIHRTGTFWGPQAYNNDDAVYAPLRILDEVLVTVFERCVEFEYSGFSVDGRFTSFLTALFAASAPRLRRFCLKSTDGREVIFPENIQALDIRTTWPTLRELHFKSVCFPQHLLRVIGLERLEVLLGSCKLKDHCQLYPIFARSIAELVCTNLALRKIELEYQGGGGEYAQLEGLENYAPVDTVFSPSLRSVKYTGLPMAYVVPAHKMDRPPQLSNLTQLSLSGVLTCPGIAGDDDTAAVAGLVRLISSAPLLEDLTIEDWIHPATMEIESLPKARLPRLAKVRLADIHPNWCYHILGALDAPALLDIDLEVEYRYGTRDGLCAFFVPTPRMPWRFPSVTTLCILIGEYSEGYMPSLAAGLECEQMLRYGDWSSLEYLTLSGHGWISNAVLDVIVDALCDGSVAPNLRQLSTVRCTTRSKSERRLEATKPQRLERDASETAVYLNDKRSSITVDAKLGTHEGLGAVEEIDDEEMSDAGETRLQVEVEFSDCELCEDKNLDESTRSDSI